MPAVLFVKGVQVDKVAPRRGGIRKAKAIDVCEGQQDDVGSRRPAAAPQLCDAIYA